MLVELAWTAHLLQRALAQQRHLVAERHGFGLVVGDVNRGRAHPPLQAQDLAHLAPQLGVEVGQRFVEQECAGVAHDGPPHRDALALPASMEGRLALEVLGQLEGLGRVLDLAADLVLGHVLAQAQREGDVLEDGEVGIEGVVLEHHGEVAVLGALSLTFFPDEQVAGDVLEADDHAQQCRLPAAGRTHEDRELAVRDVEADVIDRLEPVAASLTKF